MIYYTINVIPSLEWYFQCQLPTYLQDNIKSSQYFLHLHLLNVQLCDLLRARLSNRQNQPSLHSFAVVQSIREFLLTNRHLVVGLLIYKHHLHASGIVSRVHEISEKTNPVRISTLLFRSVQSELSRELFNLTLLEGSKKDPEFSWCLDIYLLTQANIS